MATDLISRIPQSWNEGQQKEEQEGDEQRVRQQYFRTRDQESRMRPQPVLADYEGKVAGEAQA